ncbi:MAG: diaminopimelate epimerase [Chitinophagales bacterium]|nr:diaminopimelate epimerase [Chitinophagales bacterium]
MQLQFDKYQGTGNDFILIDNRESSIKLSVAQIAFLCDRRFGIGADGLMLLENADGYDFRMVYYNADGNESTMCGNGGRCIVAFAKKLGVVGNNASFIAIDGAHTATVNEDGTVSLQMQDVEEVLYADGYTQLNTGSPHYVVFVDDVTTTDVFNTGRSIRNSERYQPKGINVNFVQRVTDSSIHVRTYERGVEDETYSCGTGVTAAAIAASSNATGHICTDIKTPGGNLLVSFDKKDASHIVNVILHGPATFVYTGSIEL